MEEVRRAVVPPHVGAAGVRPWWYCEITYRYDVTLCHTFTGRARTEAEAVDQAELAAVAWALLNRGPDA